MNEKKLKPEGYYPLDTHMSLDIIKRAKDTGDFLVAKVLYYDSVNTCLRVDLGNGFNGIIPLYEFTIYPVRRPNGFISANVYFLLDKTVHACVKKINADGTIVLSRKENMLQAFQHLLQLKDAVVKCKIVSTANFGLFVDVGHGINGLIPYVELCDSRINDAEFIGFNVGKFINAKIVSFDINKYHLGLSHKCLYSNLSNILKRGDIITAISLDYVNELHDGYFAYLNPSTSAIIDVPYNIELPYGSKIVAEVKNFRNEHPDRIRLTFISFID